jgi:hypothetical protein
VAFDVWSWNSHLLFISQMNADRRDDVFGDKGVSLGGIVALWPLMFDHEIPICFLSPKLMQILDWYLQGWWIGTKVCHMVELWCCDCAWKNPGVATFHLHPTY